MNVLTRLEYNGERILDDGLGVLQNLVRIIKVVLVTVREPFLHNTKGSDGDRCSVKELLIQLVVVNCFSVILNLITGSCNWREDAPGTKASSISMSSSIGSANAKSEIKREFLRLGILPIIKGVYRH
jgi:hypothetical protein